MINSQTKNIIFDLGGVIMNIDFRRTADAFRALGIENLQQHFSMQKQIPVFDQFETGKLTPHEFQQIIGSEFNVEIEKQCFEDAWNALLKEIPLARMELLKKLKSRYRIFLLSNTNSLHVTQINRYLQSEFDLPSFAPVFERVYYSFEIGLRKPHTEIYQHVLDDSRLIPEETLFVDDNHPNIEGAAKTGLQVLHLKPGMEITEIFA